MKDNALITGRVHYVLRGPHGEIKTAGICNNMVVTVGKQHIANQLENDGPDSSMSHMAIGTGTTPADLTDTALDATGTELSRKAFTTKEQGSGGNANQVIYTTEWIAGEGTGLIGEAGIFNASSGGVMLARVAFTSVKDKGSGDSLTLTWTLTIN